MNHELRHSSRRSAKTPSVARHGRLKRHGAWQTVAKAAASVVAVALVSGSAVAAYAAWDLAGTAKPTVTLGNESVLEGVPDVGAMEGGVNLLIIGSDSREGQGDGFGDPDEETSVLNDVNLLLHISEDHSHASVVSFPRDMIVDVPHPDFGTLREVRSPVRTEGEIRQPRRAPRLGEHTDEILREVLSYGDATIARLREGGIIG